MQVKQKNSIYYIVLMTGLEAQTDIYYTKGLKINADSYTSLLNKWTLNEADLIKVHFETTEKGIDVYLSFKDSEKRSIEFKIKVNKNKIDSFGLIAPVGNLKSLYSGTLNLTTYDKKNFVKILDKIFFVSYNCKYK